MIAGQEAKSAFERAKELKRGQNLSNWLYGKQQSLAQKEAYNKGIEAEMLQTKVGNDYNLAMEPFKREINQKSLAYQKANAGKDAIPFEQTAEYQDILNRIAAKQKAEYSAGQQTL